MPSELYKRGLYLNKNIELLAGRPIIEYDLKSANTSLCREYRLLPDSKINEIESMQKKDRVVTIGKLMKKDSVFKDKLANAFIDMRKRFFEANNLEDGSVLSIKKDAIFTIGEQKYTDFGKCIFSDKNRYTSYMYLNRLEFYYDSGSISLGGSDRLDIKGIDDIVVEKHNDYMISFFKTFLRHLETSDEITRLNYLRRFVDRYKRLELDIGYYREFNAGSIFRLNDSDEVYDDSVFIPYDNREEHLDIDYNFFNIILPLITLQI
jgi:hypothetical protein